MYRKDILEKHGIKLPTTPDEFTAAVKQITEAEKANGMFGTGLQAKSGHYSLNCDWTQMVWNEGGSIFGSDKKFKGNDEAGRPRPADGTRSWLKNAPPESTELHLGRPVADDGLRPGALSSSPGTSSSPASMPTTPRSRACGMPAKPLVGKPLRAQC